MNLTDLRDELDLHVSGLEADTSAISAGIARKVRSTKRRRAAGAVGGLCAAVLAAGLVLTNQPGRAVVPAPAVTSPSVTVGADGMPERTIPDAPGDVVKDGLRFRAKAADDTLAAAFIGDPGQSQATLSWEPTTDLVSVTAQCHLPGVDKNAAGKTLLRVGLEGTKPLFEGPCQVGSAPVGDLPTGGVTPGEPGQGWDALTVGLTARLRVQLVDTAGKPVAFDSARVAAAVYELGPQRAVLDKTGRTVQVLPEVVEHQGYRYRLDELGAGIVRGGALPVGSAPIIASTPKDVPFLVSFGSVGTGTASSNCGQVKTRSAYCPAEGSLQLVGLDAPASLLGGDVSTTVAQPARGAGTVSIEDAPGGPPLTTGTAYLAIYTLAR
jgi:hypothetical protein